MKNKQTISILIALLLLAITFSANAQNYISPDFTKFWSKLQNDRKADVKTYLNDKIVIISNDDEFINIVESSKELKKEDIIYLSRTPISGIKPINSITYKFSNKNKDTCIIYDADNKIISEKTSNILKVAKIDVDSEMYEIRIDLKNSLNKSVIFAKVKGDFQIIAINQAYE
ncbi:MAG: hypothetical protein NTW25_14510 [Candidatus Kapabacteria bacterium]|nr:hypothetical protein [Candidatus Kapabacteria bacterium]